MRITKKSTFEYLWIIPQDVQKCFLPNPTAETVIELLTENIAAHGIPKQIRTDPSAVFKSSTFKQFVMKNL